MSEKLDRIFVSIAVSKPDGDLTELPGAITASERMGQWAEANKYIPVIVNDQLYPKVTVELLRDKIAVAIKEVTDRVVLRRLVIFFAGHGASLGIGDQYWMLSNWDQDSNEAVKVTALQRMLEFYGPQQVTVIGDACQEFSARFIDVLGSAVLNKNDEDRRDFELDQFFPVDAGSQAFMIKAKDGSGNFCLFTEVMLDALEGDAPENYFESIDGGHHITSQTLALYLKENLAREAGKYGVRMDPRPRPGFYTDRIYYSAPPPPPPLRPVSDGSFPIARGLQGFGKSFSGDSLGRRSAPIERTRRNSRVATADRSVGKVRLDTRLDGKKTATKLQETLIASRRATEEAYNAAVSDDVRDHFETGCGICFTGGEIIGVQVSRGNLSQDWLPPNWYRVELGNGQDPLLWADVVVDLADGGVASGCVVQNFVTAMHAFENGTTNVLHRPIGESAAQGRDVIELLGRMQAGSLGEAEIVDAAASLRWDKHRIITLGAIVAQFYDAIRDTASLRSIAAYYAQKSQPIPLDVVLFGGGRIRVGDHGLIADVRATEERKPRSALERDKQYTFAATPAIVGHPIAGRVPWMRQAWSAIETADCDDGAEKWRELALAAKPFLAAGPFTAVKAEGREAILALAAVSIDREDPAPLVAYA